MKAKVTYTIAMMKSQMTATDEIEVENTSNEALLESMEAFIESIDPRFSLKQILFVTYPQ